MASLETPAARLADAFQFSTVAYFGVYFFDYLQTLPEELKLYTRRGLTPLTAVTIAVRYLTLGMAVVSFYMMFGNFSASTCGSIAKLPLIFYLLIQLGASILMMERVSAIWNHERLPLYFLLPIACLMIPASAISMALMSYTYVPPAPHVTTCSLVLSHKPTPYPEHFASFLLFNLAALGFALRGLQNRRAYTGVPTPPTSILYRDGIAYFSIIVVTNVVQLALYIQATPIKEGMATYACAVFASINAQRLAFVQDDGGRGRSDSSSSALTSSHGASTYQDKHKGGYGANSHVSVRPALSPGGTGNRRSFVGMLSPRTPASPATYPAPATGRPRQSISEEDDWSFGSVKPRSPPGSAISSDDEAGQAPFERYVNAGTQRMAIPPPRAHPHDPRYQGGRTAAVPYNPSSPTYYANDGMGTAV